MSKRWAVVIDFSDDLTTDDIENYVNGMGIGTLGAEELVEFYEVEEEPSVG